MAEIFCSFQKELVPTTTTATNIITNYINKPPHQELYPPTLVQNVPALALVPAGVLATMNEALEKLSPGQPQRSSVEAVDEAKRGKYVEKETNTAGNRGETGAKPVQVVLFWFFLSRRGTLLTETVFFFFFKSIFSRWPF